MGFFVTFEGIEGSGKTTQIELLRRALVKQGKEVLVTREPGGTPMGEKIRGLLLGPSPLTLMAELFLCLADRAQHIEEVLAPALASKAVVLCDRFADSTLAYQGYGRGGDLLLIARLNQIVCGSFLPHLTVLLDCPVEVGLSRATNRKGRTPDRFEAEGVGFHERVRQGYLEIARGAPERVVVVESTGSLEEAHARICLEVFSRVAKAG